MKFNCLNIFYNDNIYLDYSDSDIVTFFCNDIDINTIHLKNDENDDGDDLEVMIHVRPVA